MICTKLAVRQSTKVTGFQTVNCATLRRKKLERRLF